MPINYVYESKTKQERIKNGTKAFEGFINNGFKAMGVSHRVEITSVVPSVKVHYPDNTKANSSLL